MNSRTQHYSPAVLLQRNAQRGSGLFKVLLVIWAVTLICFMFVLETGHFSRHNAHIDKSFGHSFAGRGQESSQSSHLRSDGKQAHTVIKHKDEDRSHEIIGLSVVPRVVRQGVPFLPLNYTKAVSVNHCELLEGAEDDQAQITLQTLEGPKPIWPHLDSRRLEFGSHEVSGAKYVVEHFKYKPYLFNAPIFANDDERALFFSQPGTKRWLDESDSCDPVMPLCMDAKESKGRKLLYWKDIRAMTVIACGAYFKLPFDCSSAHAETLVDDLLSTASAQGPFDGGKGLVVVMPEQDAFSTFATSYLNKVGQALPLLADTDTLIYTRVSPSKMIPMVWKHLGLHNRVRPYTGRRIHPRQMINTCVSPQWHKGPWQAINAALRSEVPFKPLHERRRVLLVSKEDGTHGGRLANEHDVLSLLRRYCNKGVVERFWTPVPEEFGPPKNARFIHRERHLQIFRPKQYNVTGLATILADTALIVGVHGPSFSNLVFAPLGGLKVLEMGPLSEKGPFVPGYTNIEQYWMLASSVEAEYAWMSVQPHLKDATADIATLDLLLKRLLLAKPGETGFPFAPPKNKTEDSSSDPLDSLDRGGRILTYKEKRELQAKEEVVPEDVKPQEKDAKVGEFHVLSGDATKTYLSARASFQKLRRIEKPAKKGEGGDAEGGG